MHFLVLFAVLFFATEPLEPTLRPVYLSVLINGTILISTDGSLLKPIFLNFTPNVISGPALAVITNNIDSSNIQITKLCTSKSLSAYYVDDITSSTSSTSANSYGPTIDAIDIDTCTYSPPLRRSYYNEATSPWFWNKPLNASVFRIEYSPVDKANYSISCIDEKTVREYLRFLALHMQFLTNNKARFDYSHSFISPHCIEADYNDTQESSLHNKVIQLLNTKNESLYTDESSDDSKASYEWLKTVPSKASFRLFISSVFAHHSLYKMTLNSSELFSYTAAYWNYGPWIYLAHVPKTEPFDSSPVLATTELMRSFGYLAELQTSRISPLPTTFKEAPCAELPLDPLEVMGSGEANQFSIYSIASQIYQMGIVPSYQHINITAPASSTAQSQHFLLLANDCPYTRSFSQFNQSMALAIEIKLAHDFVSSIKKTDNRGLLLEYKRASNYSFGGLSIRVLNGDPNTPGGRFDTLLYSINSEPGLDPQYSRAASQPIPGRLWRCPFCDRASFGLLVVDTIAPCYDSTLLEALQTTTHSNSSLLSYSILSYFYYPSANSVDEPQSQSPSSTAPSFLPFELTLPPGVVCTSNNPASNGNLAISCTSYTYMSKSALFNLRPMFRSGGGGLRYFVESNAYSWPHFTFSAAYCNFFNGTITDTSKLFFSSITTTSSPTLQVRFRTPVNLQEPLPAILLVHYTCGWKDDPASTANDYVEVYNSKHSFMFNALLILTDENFKLLNKIDPEGYMLIRDLHWNTYSWKYAPSFNGNFIKPKHMDVTNIYNEDEHLKRDYELVHRVKRLPYTDTQCTFQYYVHAYTEKGKLINYSDVYSYTHYKATIRRIAITNLNYSDGSYTFTAASAVAQTPQNYNCTSTIFSPTLFLSKQWHVLLDTYNDEEDVSIYLDFSEDLPRYLVIFISTLRSAISIDCRMLAVIQRSVRDADNNPVMLSYKISLRELIGEYSFKRHSRNATNGVSISFSDDVVLVNVRVVSEREERSQKYKDSPTPSTDASQALPDYYLNTNSSRIRCTPLNDNITTWQHTDFNVIINRAIYTVSYNVKHRVSSGYFFYRGVYTMPYLHWDEYYNSSTEQLNCTRGTYIWRGLNSSFSCIKCPDGSLCVDNIRRPCGFGFFTSGNSKYCDRVYPGEYTTLTEDGIYQEPNYNVQNTPDGSGYLTTNCLPYMYMNKAFCTLCISFGYLCIPGREQMPCPIGFRCIAGEAIPCIGDEYQDEKGQAICKKSVTSLNCNFQKHETSMPYSSAEYDYIKKLPHAIHSLVAEGPNGGCRPCPAGYECEMNARSSSSERMRRCPINMYSEVGTSKCKECKLDEMQSDSGEGCIPIPLTVRDDANTNPEDQVCNPLNCRYECINGVCVVLIPQWARILMYFSIAIVVLVLLVTCLLVSLKFCRQFKIRRRRCDGH